MSRSLRASIIPLAWRALRGLSEATPKTKWICILWMRRAGGMCLRSAESSDEYSADDDDASCVHWHTDRSSVMYERPVTATYSSILTAGTADLDCARAGAMTKSAKCPFMRTTAVEFRHGARGAPMAEAECASWRGKPDTHRTTVFEHVARNAEGILDQEGRRGTRNFS